MLIYLLIVTEKTTCSSYVMFFSRLWQTASICVLISKSLLVMQQILTICEM